MRISTTVLLASLALASTAASQAIVAQPSGLANPGQIIDFGANLFPNFTPVSTEFGGITVTHSRYFTTGVSNNLVGGFLTNDPAGGLPNTLSITFAQPITDLSFVYHQIGTSQPSTIRALLFGTVVDSFSGTWNQSQPNNYFGFTNTVFDELQIDFVGDFNVDTLAFDPPLPVAQCNTFNGTGINPVDLACLNLPVIGSTWQGAIATNPGTLVTVLAYAPGGAATPLPLFGGELLVQVAPPPVLLTSAGSYAFGIPPTASIGASFVFQGLRVDVVGGAPTFVPLNAIELVLGL